MSRPVTLITGSSRGIGRFLAEHYLRRGHRVFGCSRGPTDLEAEGYVHFCLDVANEKEIGRLFTSIRKEEGRLDHLVNNAGIALMNHSLLTPSASLESVLRTNVIGSFLFCREAAKIMKKERFGRIVNFTTIAVPLSLEGESAYVASKAGVEGLTRVLAKEFAELGVTVNAVGPVPVMTDLIRSVPEKKIAGLVARQAIQSLGEFEDVANVVDFFLQKASRMVTGQIVYLGGV